MLAAIAASDLQPAVFVEAFLNGPVVRIWSGIGTISWNGHTWAGLGSLMSISMTEDAATVEARGISIVMSGLDATLLADCLADFRLGLPVTVYFALYASGSLIADPIISWAGRMDQPTIDVAGDTASITINCENRLIDMNIAVDRRYTHEDQQLENPGDLGFQFVNGLQETTLFWGHFPSSSNNL